MLGGNITRLRAVDRLLTLFVSIGMIFGTFALAGTTAHAVSNTAAFEVGAPETGQGSLSGLIGGTYDWDDLSLAGSTLNPDQVLVLNDTGWTGGAGVLSPQTAAQVDANCPNTSTDDIIKGGTDIDDYPFQVVSGSVPGKVDLCQVYLSWGVDTNGDTILFVGALRREVNGTVAVAVELNKISHAQRSIDDLLVTFEFDGSGPVSDIRVRKWAGSAWGAPQTVESDGDSYQHFGEIRVNLSDTNILPPPATADDCSSFSSILPYGFRGESDNSQVGDWMEPAQVTIPRCGELKIIKQATPDSGSLEFGWNVADNGGTFADVTGDIQDGETITLELVNGEYTLTEDVIPAPYALDTIECTGGFAPDAITVETGSSVTCTIYNEASSLVVKKVGEGDPSADFTFSATGQSDFDLSLGDTSQTFVYAPGTTVDISETLPGGNPAWASEGAVCTDSEANELATSNDGSISVDTIAGELITCTFTNTQDGTVTVVKEVINDHGGQLGVGDFPLFLNGSPVTSGTPSYVPADTEYTATETAQPGYTMTGISCVDDDTSANVGHPFDLAHGQSVTCTITNDDIAPSLILVKEVINDDGGNAVPGDFVLTLNGSDTNQGAQAGTVANTEYTAGENPFDGYTQVGGVVCVDNDTQESVAHPVTLALAQSVTCTITNTDIAPQLTLIKDVQNNNGGNADTNDFTLTAAGPTTISGVTGHSDVTNAEVPSGQYDLSEEGPLGYVQVGEWVCVGGSQIDGNTVDLGPGDVATCTVTNQDVAPGLTVVKEVVNDFGGTATPADFQLRVNSSAVDQNTSIPGIVANTEYTVSEDPVEGYEMTAIACVDDDTAEAVAHPVTLDEGQAVTCTVTNQDLQPELIVVKEVVNDDGGSAEVSDFALYVNGEAATSGASHPGIESNTEYTVTEDQLPGYVQVGDVECIDNESQEAVAHAVTLVGGQSVTCTITNNDQPPGLVVIKEVINDFGGDAVAGDFQLYVNGEAVNQGEPIDVDSNTEYTVTEDQLDGYELVGIVCEDSEGTVAHPVTLAEGQAVTCTVTNTDIAPELIVVKEVINDDGGDASAEDFDLFVNGEAATSGASHPGIESNTEYTVTENQLEGYFQVGDVVCVDNDTQASVAHPVSLDEGQSVTCTITNDDAAPGLIVVKEVINDDGGNAEPSDFQLRVNGEAVNQGEALDVDSNTEYTVSEDAFDGYTQVGLECVTTGTTDVVAHPVTLAEGESVTCTITNDDDPADLTLVKEVINDDNGVAVPSDFQLTLNGLAAPQDVVMEVDSNTVYTVGEQALQGYVQEGVTECVDNDTGAALAHPITLSPGQSATCVVTNNDIPDEVLPIEILPFTGAFSRELGLFAIAVMLLGILLVATSREEEEGLGG